MKDRNNESVWEIFLFCVLFCVLLVGISLFFMMMEVHTVLPKENDSWILMRTSTELNVRRYPRTGEVVEVLAEGTTVYVQVPEVRGYDSWGKICLQDGEYYWVNCYFLKEEEPAEAAEEEEYAAEEEEYAAEEEEYAAEEEEYAAEEEEYAAEESP